MYKRILNFHDLGDESCFLWGPRQTGKSTLLRQLFPSATIYDLLLSKEYSRLLRNPSLMREEILAQKKKSLIIIDEVQKIPQLLDEVQWLIVNKDIQFLLCGSSARKLKQSGANLLGGRALRYELCPLVSHEITDFELSRALNHGFIPRHYSHSNPVRLLQSYVADYLKEEIAQEGLVRNLPAFSRFLEIAAFSNGEIPVYKNIAQECSVSPPTVREYFQILEDTLIGHYLPAFQKKAKRRVVQSPKFYYFDLGVSNYLLKRENIVPGNEVYGRAFEHFIYQELLAYKKYGLKDLPLTYWRTTSQFEVDFILGDHEVAIEVKGTEEVKERHLRGLRAFSQEFTCKSLIVVSCDRNPRQIGNVLVLPWKDFLERLWAGEII